MPILMCSKCNKPIPDSFHNFEEICSCKTDEYWIENYKKHKWILRLKGKEYDFSIEAKIKEADMKTKEIDDCLTGERLKQFDIFVRGLSVKHLGLMTDWCHDIKNHYAQETKLATLKEVLKQWRIDQSANAYEDFSKWLEAEIKEVGKNAF